MRILIVEDDENKSAQIRQFLATTFGNPEIEVARSLQGGLRALRRALPQLVVLDMTLANYDAGPDESGGQTHPFGGREFLSQMDRFDVVVPVIVVTQFETFGKGPQALTLRDLDRRLADEFKATYKGAVYYHAAIHGWKQELQALIDEALTNDGK